jgi:hypothetical protein
MEILKEVQVTHITTRMKKVSFVLLLFLAVSCKNGTSNEPDQFIQNYCKCLEENNAKVAYHNARVICDSEFALNSEYFRIGLIQVLYGSKAVEGYRKSLLDSANIFNREIRRRMESECPLIISPDSSAIVY